MEKIIIISLSINTIEIDYRPNRSGGTLLTNFDKKDRRKYEKALKIYHEIIGKTVLFIDDEAYYGENGDRKLENDNSLHIICDDKTHDLSLFWEIFEAL